MVKAISPAIRLLSSTTRKEISFQGKTAIITGAGGALGKAYARDLAWRGCNLLLNDLGGALSGEDTKATKANVELLADELSALGGGKVAVNTDNVRNGEAIVKHALQEFGRVDVLINNAGNLRDKSFAKLDSNDWQSVIDVHLNGTFSMCHALWPHLLNQQYGRIINIGSGAGLYGNFGQANYSSAKMAILGLTQTLAKEGHKSNVMVNCVVPVAHSRMTETVLSADLLKELQPGHVSPIVTLLASDACTSSGACYEVGGGWFSQVRFQRSAGVSINNPAAEDLLAQWSDLTSFEHPTYPTSPADALKAMMQARDSLNNPKPAAVQKEASVETSKTSSNKASQISLKVDQVFAKLNNYLQANPSKASEVVLKVKANVLLKIHPDDNKNVSKQWLLQFHPSGPAQIVAIDDIDTTGIKPATVLHGSDKTICSMFDGSLSSEYAYLRGWLKIDGHMGVALKIKNLLDVAQSI